MKRCLFLGFIYLLMMLAVSCMALAQPPQCNEALNFSFKGFVQNSSFTNVSGANVTIYKFENVPNQPPSLTYLNSTLTNSQGFFNLSVPNGSCNIVFKVSVKQFFGSGNVSEISPTLPPMPKMAFTQMLNGGTFYLQPAATLRLSAVNSSGNSTGFAYMVSDTSFGMPLDDNFNSLVTSVDVVVPRNRNYTVLMVRPPTVQGVDMYTATPPVTSPLITNLSDYGNLEYVAPINLNLSFSQYTISGFVNVAGNTTRVNLSNILIRFTSNDMAPEQAIVSGLSQTIVNQPGTQGYIASYNITVMGASGGIEQLVEFYGRNDSVSTNANGEYFAFFQNFSVSGNINNFNVTLTPLAGNYTTSTFINTSMVTVNLTDGDQGGFLQDAHVEVSVVNAGNVKTFRFMKDQLSSGIFSIPLLLNSNATLKIFSSKFAPLEKKLNLSNLTNSSPVITLTMKGFNMEKMGQGVGGNKSNFSDNSDVRVRFMRNTAACNVYEPDVSSCRLGDDKNGGFNPLMAMMSGKTNIRIDVPASNSTLYFIGVDLLASGPPDGMMSDQANQETTTNTSIAQLWKFGSMAPKIYDEVRIGIPYNESRMNESKTINITLMYLYDNDWNIVWNASNDPYAANLPSGYSDFNLTWFNISSTGMPCTTSTSSDCFINTSSNIIWMRIPHFSSGGYYINSTSVDQTPPRSNATLTAVGDSNVDGNINMTWTDDANETGETYRLYRNTSIINSSTISGATLIASGILEGTQYYIDNSTTSGINYWYALVTVDWTGNYNESVVSNSLNATANDTVAPRLPTQVNATASGGTTTITWTNVTRDVNNSMDLVRYTVWYWLNTTHYWNATNWETRAINESIVTVLVSNTSATSTTHSVTDFPNNNSVRYYYFVTTFDDSNNTNRSIYNGVNINLTTVSAPVCTSGVVIPSTGCTCGGTFYKSGYCCNSSTFQASACSSSSDTGSSGGGGGGASSASNAYTASFKWATVLSGALTAMSIDNTNIAFTKLQFLTSSVLSNVDLKVTALTLQPSAITKIPDDTLYQYLSVDSTNLPSGQLSSVMIFFRLPKTWFTLNNLDHSTVKLSRYENGTWNKLITTLVSSEEKYYKYSASTPGFSYFAVTAAKNPTGSEQNAPVGTTPESNASGITGTNISESDGGKKAGEEKAFLSPKSWVTWLIAIVVVAGIVGGFFYYKKKKLQKPTYGFQ